MSPRLFVPHPDSDAVQKLLAVMGTDKKPVVVRVEVASHRAQEGCCYQNVGEKVSRVGGRAQVGWAVWQHESLFIEAEPHAVYDSAHKGQPWTDPTPNFFPDGSRCREILFVPNDATCDPECTVIEDNVRVPLLDDPRVREALELASERIALLNSIPKEWQSAGLMYHYSAEHMQREMQLEFRIASLCQQQARLECGFRGDGVVLEPHNRYKNRRATMKGPMKLIDANTGLMECRICGSRHTASLQSGSERADGVTRYYRGSWQCSNEQCASNLKEWDEGKNRFVKPSWRKFVEATV